MSRSRRKTPICGWSCAESEKKDKQLANRTFRRVGKRALVAEKAMPLLQELSQVYDFAKNGKQVFDPRKRPKEMRK